MNRRWTTLLALALGIAIASAVMAVWVSYWVPFAPNLDRFNSAASYALASARGSGTWIDSGVPWRLSWLAKGHGAAVFVNRGHRFVFFPQVRYGSDHVAGYFYSVDGTPPFAVLEEGASAPRLAPGWWSGSLSQEFLAGG